MIAFCCSLDPHYAFNRFMCGDTACTSHTDSGETFGEDEGFDQGGLRKAWIALIATHFVRSDLSVHAEEEASHLDSERRLQAEGHSLKSLPLSSSSSSSAALTSPMSVFDHHRQYGHHHGHGRHSH